MLERTLSEDTTIVSAYLQTWRLKLSHGKTVTAAFHLHNQKAKRDLKVKNNCKILPFFLVPTYLGVKLDRALTYRHHLEALRKKTIHARFATEATCGFRMGHYCQDIAHTTLFLIYSTAEYCAPAWCLSAHTRLIDSVLNDALRIVTGCLRATAMDNLPVLSGTQSSELRRQRATLSLANCKFFGLWPYSAWPTD